MSIWKRCAVDSGIVAMAMGIMAMTAVQEMTGIVKCGTCMNAAFVTEEKSTWPMARDTRYPVATPNRMGSWPRTPLSTTENRMVAASVTRAMVQLADALPIAVPASAIPITMAIEPVTVAGRILLILSMPTLMTRNPASIDTSPDMMMPNCACPMSSSEARTPYLTPVIEIIAAR